MGCLRGLRYLRVCRDGFELRLALPSQGSLPRTVFPIAFPMQFRCICKV